MMRIVDFRVDDVLQLRKRHPCGGFDWRVYRIGADIGLVCTTCSRQLMLERAVVEKRMKDFVSRGRPSALSDSGASPAGEAGG